jgi:capsular exopolysaccharide synthesis family protein
MSKFFKALEQAERERALREAARQTPAFAPEPQPEVSVTPHTATFVSAPDGLPAVEPGLSFDGVEEHLVSLLRPTSFQAEPYRALRQTVEQLNKSTGLAMIAVSSPDVEDGKTVTAINLAGALAQAVEARVLLVETDLRRPAVARQLGMGDARGRGLVDALLNPRLALEEVVQPRPPFNLAVLPAGNPPAAPYEVLKAPRLGELLGEARQQYDYVVLDTAPLVPVPDTRLIAKWVDGFLVVVAAHKTRRKLVEEALRLLDADKIVGLVFNEDDRPLPGRYHAYRPSSYDEPSTSRTPFWRRLRRSRS